MFWCRLTTLPDSSFTNVGSFCVGRQHTDVVEQAEQLAWEDALEEVKQVNHEEALPLRLEEQVKEKSDCLRREEQQAMKRKAQLDKQERLKEQARLKAEARRAYEEETRLAREEELRRKEAARSAQEQEKLERRRALERFFLKHGFTGVNEPRRGGCSILGAATTYPLHCAAELAELETVEILLKEGAVEAQTNSAGKTAAQVAMRKNVGSSHDAVLLRLGKARVRAPRSGGA